MMIKRKASRGTSSVGVLGWRQLASVVAVLALVLTACGDEGGDEGDGGGPTDAAAESEGADGTVTIAMQFLDSMQYAPSELAQDNEKYMTLMGNALIGVDPETSQYVGELAESWELSDDGRTWTFKLKPDIPFHPGPEGEDYGTVTSEDVKFSWRMWSEPEYAHHTPQPIFNQAVGGDVDEGFEIVSDLEFKLHAEEPVYDLAQVLCSCEPGMTVYAKEAYDEYGLDYNQPIGTGPFKYVSHAVGDELVLERFDDYAEALPGDVAPFKNLVIKEIPDGAARLTQVQAGTVDLALLDGALLGEAEAAGLPVMGIPNVRNAWVHLGGSYWSDESQQYLDEDAPWIQADNPEQGKAIREAMSLAIDRETILQQALGGFGSLSYAPLTHNPDNPDMTRDSWELPEYNPDLAREKLAEGGYPDGFSFEMPLIGDDFDTRTMGEMIAGMWREIGLDPQTYDVEEDVLEQAENEYDLAGKVYVTSVSVAPEMGRPLFSYTTKEIGTGTIKFTHNAIDEGFEKIQASPTYEERAEANLEMLDILREDRIALTLMTGDMLYVGSNRIEGWTPIPGLNIVNSLHTLELAE